MNNLAMLLALQGIKLDEALETRQPGDHHYRARGRGARLAGERLHGPW